MMIVRALLLELVCGVSGLPTIAEVAAAFIVPPSSQVEFPPLRVIGAGFGRTSTDSLRTALNRVGYRTCAPALLNSFLDLARIIDARESRPRVLRDGLEHPDKGRHMCFIRDSRVEASRTTGITCPR